MKKFKITYTTTNGDILYDVVCAPNSIDAMIYFYFKLHKSERTIIEKVEEIKQDE